MINIDKNSVTVTDSVFFLETVQIIRNIDFFIDLTLGKIIVCKRSYPI